MRWIALFACLALTLFPAFAADSPDDWGRVKKLSPGTSVTVIQSDMKSLRGPLRAASDNEIVVASAGTDVTVPKDRVVRISSHRQSRRVSNAIVLAVAGGLIGAGVTRFGIACAETNDGCRNALLATVGGAAGGAALGATVLPDTVEIYRIPKK